MTSGPCGTPTSRPWSTRSPRDDGGRPTAAPDSTGVPSPHDDESRVSLYPMNWWQTAIVAGVTAAIAPLFLWLQQRQQNARESEKERLALTERSMSHEREAAQRIDQGLRDAYVQVLRSAYRFRAERSPWVLRNEAVRDSGRGDQRIFSTIALRDDRSRTKAERTSIVSQYSEGES